MSQTLPAKELLKLLPHRYPFLLVDRVEELEPGESAVGIKCVTVNEPCFQGHFPGHPIFPGVLIAEAFAQVAGVVALSAHPDFAGQAVYLLGFDKLRFRKPVEPGDRLRLHVKLEFKRRSIWEFSCVARVDDQRVATGKLMATLAEPPS